MDWVPSLHQNCDDRVLHVHQFHMVSKLLVWVCLHGIEQNLTHDACCGFYLSDQDSAAQHLLSAAE